MTAWGQREPVTTTAPFGLIQVPSGESPEPMFVVGMVVRGTGKLLNLDATGDFPDNVPRNLADVTKYLNEVSAKGRK